MGISPRPGVICPRAPAPFDYDPLREDAAKVADRIAAEVRGDVLAQIDALVRAARGAGVRTVPPGHAKTSDLRRMARRLYRAAVKGLPWETIAEIEREERPDDYPDAQSVRLTVWEWSRDLKVPLRLRRVGRSPKHGSL